MVDAAIAQLAEPEDQPGVVVGGVMAEEPGLGVATLAIPRLLQMAANVQDARVGATVGLLALFEAELPVFRPVRTHVGGVAATASSLLWPDRVPPAGGAAPHFRRV